PCVARVMGAIVTPRPCPDRPPRRRDGGAWDCRYHPRAAAPRQTGDMLVDRRSELAAFLRSRRARLRPRDVGLPETGSRRTPGLRRQEGAQLAGMSGDYYIPLEQGRGPRPSRPVLAALARALMLSVDERAYLFNVTGETPPPSAGPDRTVPTAITRLLATLTLTPAYVVDAAYNVLAWNHLATHFITDLSA